MSESYSGFVRNLVLASMALPLFGGCSSQLAKKTIDDVDSVVAYPATGGVVVSTSRDPGKKAICVAPPAQGAMNVNLTLKHDGKVNVLKYVEVETQNALELKKSLATLYEQNERTLFLQFSLYRLCESYANGMLDDETFAEAMARESLGLKRASDEAEARLATAKMRQKDAGDARNREVPLYEEGLKEVKVAEKQLAAEASRLTLAQEKALEAGVKAPGAKSDELDKAKRAAAQAEHNVEEAKKRIAGEEWRRAEKAVLAAAAADVALAAADAEAKSLKSSSDYAKTLATDAINQESAFFSSAKAKRDPAAARRQLSRQNYARLFERVLSTAEALAKQQVELAKAEAEKAKIEAEVAKAKAEADKGKASEESKKMSAKLEALQDKLVDAAVSRAGGCGEKCGSASPSSTGGSGKKADGKANEGQ